MKRLGLFALCAASALAAENSFLLRNVTIHPVSSAEISGGSILVTNGKIADFGKTVSAKGARVIDGHGLHVYPGMIDAYTDIGLSEISSVRETNDTNEIGDFHPQLRALIAINPESAHIPVTRVNGITSAVSVASGGMISGQAALIHLDGWTWEDMAVKRSVAMNVRLPVITTSTRNFIDGNTRRPYADAKKQYETQLQQLGTYMENARGYRQAKGAASRDFKTDLGFEAMLPVLDGTLPVIIPAAREREIKDALDFAEKNKIKLILFGVIKPGTQLARMKAMNVAVILGPTLELPLDEDDPYDAMFSLPDQLYKAGIKFAFSTSGEGGPGSVEFARNLPYEASAAAGFGLPKEEALRAVTINAAEILGVADQIGSIDKGKAADLVLCDGDMLETRTNIKKVFIAGKDIDLTNRQTQLYEKYKARP